MTTTKGAALQQSSLAELLAKRNEARDNSRSAFLEFASRQTGSSSASPSVSSPSSASSVLQPVPQAKAFDRFATDRKSTAPASVSTAPRSESRERPWVLGLEEPVPTATQATDIHAHELTESDVHVELPTEKIETLERELPLPFPEKRVSAEKEIRPSWNENLEPLDDLAAFPAKPKAARNTEPSADAQLRHAELADVERPHAELPHVELPVLSDIGSAKPERVKTELPKSGEAVLYGFQPIDSATHESELHTALSGLSDLIANVIEAYSASIFVAHGKDRILEMFGAHTLSREFAHGAKIPFGSGLVGWVAENARRISVCPFENDATTLLYYTKDQALKSFIAVPIVDSRGRLLGVIACDSKKSYAFSKIGEKILVDCAKEAAKIIELHQRLSKAEGKRDLPANALEEVLESLRTQEDERSLLSTACDLPDALVRRDALVVLSLAEGGIGEGVFYSKASESRIGNRLLEHVCRHKRIICGERSVHAPASDDTKNRSFLSIPFHVLGREAGSLNLLSRPHDAFQATEIVALEKIAHVIGKELERIRLRMTKDSTTELLGMQSWKTFELQAKVRLTQAKKDRTPLTLIRLRFSNMVEIESARGIDSTVSAIQRLFRLIEQVKGHDALACPLYGTDLLLLIRSEETDRMLHRLKSIIAKPVTESTQQSVIGEGIGAILIRGLSITSSQFPRDGETITDLAAKTLRTVEEAKQPEVAVNAWNWR